MQEFLSIYFEWLRAFHIISVIAWMAGMLYLPRLFVYHSKAEIGSEMSETFKIMERRLFKIIMNPAMIAAWIFGSLMLYANWDLYKISGWLHAKLLFVFLMTGIHHLYIKYLKSFAADKNEKSEKFYRILNEVPTIIMFIIVILAVVQPF